MNGEVDVRELVDRIVVRAGVEVDRYAEELALGIHLLSVDDPASQGAPVALIWSPGDGVVTHIGHSGARMEMPLTAAGAREFDRVLTAVFLGEVVETVYRSGADVRVRYRGNEIARMRFRKGIFVRRGKVISEKAYPSYGSE